MTFGNEKGEKVVLTMNGKEKQFLLDRTQSGDIDFQEDFGVVMKMPVDNLPEGENEFRILMDRSSVEVFLNGGQYVMTAQLFPNENYSALEISNTSSETLKLSDFQTGRIKRVW